MNKNLIHIFFSNTKFDLEDGLFDETTLEINLEKVSNDTYLKKYDINSSFNKRCKFITPFFMIAIMKIVI